MDFSIALSSVLLLVFLFLKVPVFISILGAAATYFALHTEINSVILAQRVLAGSQSIPLLAIPFFVCAGVFMNYTGVTKRIVDFCEAVVGNIIGGVGHVTVLVATLMGGLSGSNLADAAMEAKMLVPEMEKRGFSKAFGSVLVATSAIITPLIPPGIAMIIYGSIANVSIGKLFVAGIGPGVILCVTLMILVALVSYKRGYRSTIKVDTSAARVWKTFRGAFLPLCLPVIIIGGIRIGAFTPTEAGSVAIVYSLFLGFIYREMTLKDVIRGMKETVLTSSAIMLIIAAASAFAWALTKEKVPQYFTGLFIEHLNNPVIFLLCVNLFLLIIGMFIEGNAAMIILVPLLAPLAKHFGIDEIHFAMVVIFNFALGALSPPMGTLMFVTCSITKCPMGRFIKEAIPFYILLLACLLLLTFVPSFSTALVNLIY
ncbi:TRAP transporter large permease [Succinivibrio dextrinosolvens]|jgi:tripartite ATP-independent transporter DctM subunit|uniref:TRAP transporter large permease n=1 Tax=Succinivibrio dextrinosolvens TaxID=83771 RepID=UPI0024203AD8|nr:TRAP transporter large permease [Succinivibrio dextrinosolvens]MBE6422018.1 TRAP transporter large permease [Succinivibrio dextrinosolvens]